MVRPIQCHKMIGTAEFFFLICVTILRIQQGDRKHKVHQKPDAKLSFQIRRRKATIFLASRYYIVKKDQIISIQIEQIPVSLTVYLQEKLHLAHSISDALCYYGCLVYNERA